MKTLHTIYNNFAKRNLASLRLLLVMLLTLTVSVEVWADYTITFKTGSGSEVTTKAAIINSGVDYVSSVSASKTYAESDGLRYGNGDAMGYTTFTLSNAGQIKASKIIFQGAKYYSSDNSSLQYTITYTDASTTSGTIALTNTATDKEATLESSKTISKIDIRKTANSKKRFYVQGLEIVSAAVANHTVTFDAGSGSCSTPNFTQTSTTRSVNLPSASTTCEGWTFAGWCTSSAGNQDENSTSPGTILLPGTSYTPNSTHTLYAVYTRSEDGASATTTESYGFENTDDATNWTINGPVQNNSYKKTGSYAGKINSNNTYITYKEKVNVTSFSFQFMRESTNSNYNVYIETSPDNQTWTAVETYAMSSFSTSKTWYPKSHTFDGKKALYVRFRCYNTTAVRWVDDVSITYVGGATTYYMTDLTCATQTVVTLNPNGGTPNEVKTYTIEETSYTLPECPFTRIGYNFAGWATSASGNALYTDEQTITGLNGTAIDLYAKWTPKTTTITLAYQDGSGTTEKVTATYDQPMPNITVRTRDGYNFKGYFTANGGTGTQYYNADGTSAKNWDKEDASCTLIAYWEAKKLINYRTFCQAIITLDPNTGTFAEIPAGWSANIDGTYTKSVNQNRETSLPTPQKENYAFAGWKAGEETYTDKYTPTTDEVTLTAQWNCIPPTSVEITPTNENGWRYSLGETISLKATATGGSGNYTYQWQKYIETEWKNIEGATSDTYSKANCTSGDGGSYRCVVSTGNNCSSYESYSYFVRVFTLNGAYYGEDWTENTIVWSSTNPNQGTVTLHLEESKTYLFKVADNNGKWFGYGDASNYIVQPWQEDCGTDNADIRLFTGPKGDYTFTINIEHALDGEPYVNIDVAYPEVEHPVAGYGYITQWWDECYIHWWDNSNNALTEWGNDANITTSTTICGTDYYYFPILDNYTNLIIKDAAGDAGNTTGNQTQTGHSGWYITHDGTAWKWNEFAEYAITFLSNGGIGTIDPIVEICPNTDITLPNNTLAKEGCTFMGWTANVPVKANGTNVPAGSTIADGATIQNITSNITLTAQWFQKIATTLQWSADAYTAALEADNTYPVLTISPETSKEAVQYASADETVATIDENGNITLVGVGTTTIIASIAEDNKYLSATASYTLTVVEANCKWIEVTIDQIQYGDEIIIAVPGKDAYGADMLYMLQDPQAAQNPKVYQMNVSDLLNTDNVDATIIWNIRKCDDDQNNFTIYRNGSTTDRLAFITNYGVRVGGDNADSIFTITTEKYLKSIITKEYLSMSGSNDWRHYKNTTQSFKFYKRECLDATKVWVEGNLTNVTCDQSLPLQLEKDGSISLTFTAEEGYQLPADVTVTNATKEWNSETGKLTISDPTDDVSITVKAIKRHTVKWMVGDNTILTEDVLDNEKINTTPDDPEDNALGYCASKFVGWSETDLGSAAGQSAPDDLCSAAEIKAKYTSLTEDKTFYAVFATPEGGTTGVSLSFANTAQRTSYSTEQQIWEQNGITLTNDKGSSTSNVGDYANPARFYKNSSITIEYAYPMYKIVFDCNGDDKNEHITNLAPSIDDDNVQVNQEGEIVTVEFDEPVESYTITLTAGQVRLDNLTIIPIAYSNYVTQCDDLPTPTYAGPSIDKNELKVKCGDRSSMNSAAVITFDPTTNYDLSLPITLTASEGFLLSTNKTKNDAYTSSVTVNPVKSGDNKGKITQNVYVRAEASADTKADYTGTITIEGAQVETKTIDVTAIVTCEPHTMTFYSYNTKTKAKYYVGDAVEEPETPGQPCEGYVFDGWAESIVEEGATTYSKVTFPYEMPNRNTILYAVYQIQEGSNYTKVTEDLADYSGEYLIVYESENVAFNGGLQTLDDEFNTISVTINSNTIESNATTDAAKFTIAKVDGGYSIKSASGYYIGGKTTDDNGLLTAPTTAYNTTISFENDVVDLVQNSKHLRYNAAANQKRFRYYKSGQQSITLYKKDISYTSYPDCTPLVEPETPRPRALPSAFSVSETEKVQFSAGNLQYHTSDKVWRFAPEQYDVLGEQNIELGNPNFKDWVDMFGWSTNDLGNNFGVNPSNDQNDYKGEFVDWGKVFSDAKYGISADEWYTLSMNEWYYLLYTRTKASSLKQVATVGDMIGVLLFPDEWVMPKGIEVSEQTDADGVKYYPYTIDQWKQLEAAGAVFLPAAGRRTGGWGNTTVSPHIEDKENPDNFDSKGYYRWQDNTNYYGYYWTSTKDDSDGKSYFLITCKIGADGETGNPSLPSLWDEQGRYGQSVRLVRKLMPLQVVEWKENSVVVMYNGDPAQTATVTISNEQKGTTTLSDVQKDIAVYELPATGLASSPNQPLEIAIGNAKALMTIPYVATATTTNVPNNSDLVILKDATFTATDEQLRNVTVYGGGTLVVGEGATLSTNSLTLRIGGVTAEGSYYVYDYVYPQFVLNGTWTNTSGKINLDYLTTKEQYYTFVAPFAVQTKDIHYPVDIYGNNVAATNKGSFEFQYYDGAARATGATGWKTVEEDPTTGATLEPGQGYTFLGMPKKVSVNGGSSTRQKFGIHRIPMIITAEQAMTHENSNQSAPLSVHLADKNNDSGWNLIGNPYMATISGLTNEDIQVGKLVHTTDANGNWTGGWHWDEQTVREGQRFLVIPSNDGQSFESTQASNANLPAFKNFFVQISNKNANALVIPYNKPTNVLAAPARRTEEVDQDIELAIVLEQDEAHSDQLDFLINNAYTAEFDYKADFTKMMNTTNLNLYGVHTDDNLSFLALDNYSAQQSVAIGYQVPAAGEYMLRMSDKAYVMFEHIEALYVTDHEMSPEQTVDIMEEPYTFHVAKAETNNTRFTVSLKLRDSGGGVVTGFENVSTDSEQPLKFFYQDKLYIMRNGVIYDATGKQVHVINE